MLLCHCNNLFQINVMNVAGRRRRRRMAERAQLKWKGCLMLSLSKINFFEFTQFTTLTPGRRQKAASAARMGFEAILSLAINLKYPTTTL